MAALVSATERICKARRERPARAMMMRAAEKTCEIKRPAMFVFAPGETARFFRTQRADREEIFQAVCDRKICEVVSRACVHASFGGGDFRRHHRRNEAESERAPFERGVRIRLAPPAEARRRKSVVGRKLERRRSAELGTHGMCACKKRNSERAHSGANSFRHSARAAQNFRQ